MNPDEVERLAHQVRIARTYLEKAAESASTAADISRNPFAYAIQPGGLLLAPGAIIGTHLAAAKVQGVLAAIEIKVGRLLAEAQQQRDVSAQYRPGVSLGSAGALIPAPPVNASPENVKRWWDSLSEEDKALVLEATPEVVRNLDGIPAAVRVEAQKRWAQEHWDDPARSDAEKAYLKQVADGTRSLYLYDESNERIIEVVGKIGPDTKNVVTYVPGTGADMGDFYDGSVQQFAEGLNYVDQSGGTVVFVYKDGPWVTWPQDNVSRSNINPDYLSQKGEELARFNSLISNDPDLGQARTTVIGHSAGNTIAAYSEMHGARYDNYISLGGSWLPIGWVPSSSTEYDHLQYFTDAINGLDGVAATPNNSMFFQKHYQGWGDVTPGENHERIAEREGNMRAIIRAFEELTDGKR